MKRTVLGTAAVKLALALVVGSALALSACHRTTPSSTDRTLPEKSLRFAELIYDGGLRNGWTDAGAGQHTVSGPGPASVSLSPDAGWTVTKAGLRQRSFGALALRLRTSDADPPFLEVRLQSSPATTFPKVRLRRAHLKDVGDGWSQVLVPFEELDPYRAPFDSVVLRASRAVTGPVLMDKFGFTPAEGLAARLDPTTVGTARRMQVDCSVAASSISPLVYGISYYVITDKDDSQWGLGATGRRWGGNSTTRYNWELGTAWNSGKDWFWENVEVPPYTKFLDANDAHGMKTALTVPMIGWVSKDTTSYSFPVAEFGPQKATDSEWRPQAGNGFDPQGKPIRPGPPTKTSAPASPEFIARWVRAIAERDRAVGHRSVDIYMLDNEPMLWNTTHRDVHPEPLTYDELLERTLSYGAAVRAADPGARIAGPAEWGWPAFFYSAKDSSIGLTLRPDRRAHGDVPLLPWYLRRLREEEQRTGTHILDLVDVHFYPQAVGIYGNDGKTDPASAALRIRSTRGLWDPSYTDESFIGEPVYLLPRLRKWIDENYPGRGIVIGEWNFGAERHMSGGLATAEALGRFTQNGVSAAFYWTYPPKGSPTFQAFRAFRDFDGKGGRFLDYSLPTTAAEPASLFASRDAEGKHVVALALNFSPDTAVVAEIDLQGCGPVARRTTFVYGSGSGGGFDEEPATVSEGQTLVQRLPPYSITVFDVRLAGAIPVAVQH